MERHVGDDGVCVLRYNRPRKANAWTKEVLDDLFAGLDAAAADADVVAVVITGTGKYFSAGADFSMYGVALPSTLRKAAADITYKIFDAFIEFPKPIFCVVNGPAIGGAVTTASLCDGIIVSERAKFRTPFAELGISPEGCSTYTFERRYGADFARRMLIDCDWLSASDAVEHGFACELVPGDDDAVLARGRKVATEWVAAGKCRSIEADGTRPQLKLVNREESEKLGQSILSPKFLDQQVNLAREKGRTGAFILFFLLSWTRPLWAML